LHQSEFLNPQTFPGVPNPKDTCEFLWNLFQATS